MGISPIINELVDALSVLPGVGKKTAQRMAFHLLDKNRAGGTKLAGVLQRAVEQVGRCARCQNLTEKPLCDICTDTRRTQNVVCVVETPTDLLAIEQAGTYRGQYFVLMGRLSPIDGIGPEEIGLDKLKSMVETNAVTELVLATNPTVEGDATAFFIADMFKQKDVLVTRIAHGIPVGGELGYVDGGTLSYAINGRKPIHHS